MLENVPKALYQDTANAYVLSGKKVVTYFFIGNLVVYCQNFNLFFILERYSRFKFHSGL